MTFSLKNVNWLRNRRLQNEYLVKDLRGALRKHLTRLLGLWCELENREDEQVQEERPGSTPKGARFKLPSVDRNSLNIATARRLPDGPVLFEGSSIEMPVPEINCGDFEWTLNFYRPERELDQLSKPEFRCSLSSGSTTFEEEQAIQSGEPSELAREVSLRLFEEASGEALSVLRQYAESNPFRSYRLRSRVCSAIRAELAALVAEWDQVATEDAKAGTEVGNEAV